MIDNLYNDDDDDDDDDDEYSGCGYLVYDNKYEKYTYEHVTDLCHKKLCVTILFYFHIKNLYDTFIVIIVLE